MRSDNKSIDVTGRRLTRAAFNVYPKLLMHASLICRGTKLTLFNLQYACFKDVGYFSSQINRYKVYVST